MPQLMLASVVAAICFIGSVAELEYPPITMSEGAALQAEHGGGIFLLPVTFPFYHIKGKSLVNDDLVFVKKSMKAYFDYLVTLINEITNDRLGEFRVDGHYLALMGDFMPYSFGVTATVGGMERRIRKVAHKAKKLMEDEYGKPLDEILNSTDVFSISVYLLKSFEVYYYDERIPAQDYERMNQIVPLPNFTYDIVGKRKHMRTDSFMVSDPAESPFDEYAILCDWLLHCGIAQCQIRQVLLPTSRSEAERIAHVTIPLILGALPRGNESWYHNAFKRYFRIRKNISNYPLPWESYDPISPEAVDFNTFRKWQLAIRMFVTGAAATYFGNFGNVSSSPPLSSQVLMAWCQNREPVGMTDRRMRVFVECTLVILLGVATIVFCYWRRVAFAGQQHLHGQQHDD